MKMRDAVIDAIDRVRSEKCTQNFSLDDFKSQYATIVEQTGSKSKKPQNTINVHLQELVKAGALRKEGRGQFVIVGDIRKGAALAKKTSAKKASAKKTSAKKASAKTASTAKKASAKKASAKTASTAKKTSAKAKSSKKVSGAKRKRAGTRQRGKSTHKTLGFATYIYKVMKHAAPKEMAITRKTMAIVESFVVDTLHRLANAAFDLSQQVGRKTLTESDVQFATKFLLPGELRKYALNEGMKATTRYAASKGGPSTKRAGLLFSVPRTERFFRAMMPHTNISATAPVYAAAVMEYIIAEIFELSSNFARDVKRMRLVPRHIYMSASNDAELHHLFKHATIAQSGVYPNIHDELLPKPKKQRK